MIIKITEYFKSYPLLVDSDTVNMIRQYSRSGNNKHISGLVIHLQIQYEFLKYKLNYSSNYIFTHIIHVLYVT